MVCKICIFCNWCIFLYNLSSFRYPIDRPLWSLVSGWALRNPRTWPRFTWSLSQMTPCLHEGQNLNRGHNAIHWPVTSVRLVRLQGRFVTIRSLHTGKPGLSYTLNSLTLGMSFSCLSDSLAVLRQRTLQCSKCPKNEECVWIALQLLESRLWAYIHVQLNHGSLIAGIAKADRLAHQLLSPLR